MATERTNLRDAQWADIERRPSHGQIKEIERLTRQAITGSTPGMGSEEAAVLVLVRGWEVSSDEGAPLPLKRESFDAVPSDVWAAIVDDCQSVLDSIRPADALVAALRSLRAMRDSIGPDHRARLGEMMDELTGMAGATRPNGEAQAAI